MARLLLRMNSNIGPNFLLTAFSYGSKNEIVAYNLVVGCARE